MPEETLVVDAPVVENLEIPRSNTPEYVEWRKSGELPKNEPKTEAPASSDPSKETHSEPEKAEIAPDPESGQKQQENRRKPDAEARIKQLNDELKATRAELEEARKPKTPAESSPAKEQPKPPQSYEEYRKTIKPSQWIAKYLEDHPGEEYEDGSAALVDHLTDARDHFKAAAQARSDGERRFNEAVVKARELYPDFDGVADPMAGKVNELIHNPSIDRALRKALLDPEAAHVLYALGKDAEIADKFGKLALEEPDEAIFLWKSLKRDALNAIARGDTTTSRNDKGQFEAPKTPVKRGPESAPAPPLEIGSRGSGTMDEAERAFQAIERGDPKATRAFMDAENRKDLRQRRGV